MPRARNLGSFDPYLRQMHIGPGCAIENMMLAAAALGLAGKVTVVEGPLEPIAQAPRPTLVATIELSAATPHQCEPMPIPMNTGPAK
jgi:hypothetical protein